MTCIRKLKTTFDHFSLKHKLMSLFLVNNVFILITIIMSLSIFSYAYSEKLYRAVAANLSFSSQRITDDLKSVEALSSMSISSTAIQNALSKIYGSDDALDLSKANQEINRAISSYQQNYKNLGVSCILLYSRSSRNTTDFAFINKANPEIIQTALSQTRQYDGAISWTINRSENLAILGRSIRKISNLDLTHLGDILFFVDFEKIISRANRSVTTYEDARYILCNGEQILYASPDLSEAAISHFRKETDRPYQIINYGGHSYFVVTNNLFFHEWTYINLIPYDQISKSSQIVLYLVLVIMVIAFLCSLLFTNNTICYILRNINLLIQKMDFFSNSNLQTPQINMQHNHGSDEIDRLHQHFDIMVEQIQELIQKNYISEILRRDASLKALEAQINPHFLYNTLETINWRAKALGDSQISAIAESLGTLLRATLSNRKPLVTLEYELDLARCFMTIHQIRFEERLQFHMQCEENLTSALIPPLTIQPLLENAIRYGVEEVIETCMIQINVFRSGEKLFVEVSNEGSCFEDDLLEKLLSGEKHSHGFGIGLVNIHQRIQILFGSQYGLSFLNRNDCAVAIITIPYTTKEDSYVKTDYRR